jgi:hypothetical protein
MGVLIGIVAFCIIVCMLVGPEFHGTQYVLEFTWPVPTADILRLSSFEQGKTAMQKGGGLEDTKDLQGVQREKMADEEVAIEEKPAEYRRE